MPGLGYQARCRAGLAGLYLTGSAGLDLSSFGYSGNRFGVHWHFRNDEISPVGADLYARGT